jgi:hypothetical protein
MPRSQLAGAAPVRDRPLHETRVRQMLGQHLRLGFANVRELLFERLGDPGVQLLALRLEQRLVRYLLD